MIFDQSTLFSDRQSITVSAASSNVVDLGPTAVGMIRDVGNGVAIPMAIQVVETFGAAGAATLTVELQTDSDEDFGSPKTLASTGAIGKADLVAGDLMSLTSVSPGANERYMRLYYTVATGPMTIGKIMAGIVAGVYSNG